MRNINYKDDFELDVRLTDVLLNARGIPPYPFEIKLYSGGRTYSAGRKNGKLYNIVPSTRGDEWITVVADNHKLLPCKELIAEVILQIPNANYPDGYQQIVRRYNTEICLSVADTDIPTSAEIEIVMPYIKGEKGEKGDKGDLELSELTDEQTAELRERLALDIPTPLSTEEITEIVNSEYQSNNNTLNSTDNGADKDA